MPAGTCPPAVSIIEGSFDEMNEALSNAETEFLIFKERHAAFSEETITYLLKNIKGVGMALCGYSSDDDESPEEQARVLSSPDMACRLFFRLHDQSMLSNKIFRTSVIKRHGIRLHPEFKAECGCAFLADYLMHCRNVRHAPLRLVELSSSDDEEVGFEDTARSLYGFDYMRKLLSKKAAFSEASYYCTDYMADVIFSLYSEIVFDGPENEEYYRDSVLRRFARKLPSVVKRPKDKESLYYYRAIMKYGFFGRADYEI